MRSLSTERKIRAIGYKGVIGGKTRSCTMKPLLGGGWKVKWKRDIIKVVYYTENLS